MSKQGYLTILGLLACLWVGLECGYRIGKQSARVFQPVMEENCHE